MSTFCRCTCPTHLDDGYFTAIYTYTVARRQVCSIQRMFFVHCAGAAGSSDPAAPPASALSYAEQLACALIANLGGGPAAAPYTVEGSTTPGVAALADELLAQLLAAFPALYHSQACYCGLLVQLQQEEGDVPLGKVR